MVYIWGLSGAVWGDTDCLEICLVLRGLQQMTELVYEWSTCSCSPAWLRLLGTLFCGYFWLLLLGLLFLISFFLDSCLWGYFWSLLLGWLFLVPFLGVVAWWLFLVPALGGDGWRLFLVLSLGVAISGSSAWGGCLVAMSNYCSWVGYFWFQFLG